MPKEATAVPFPPANHYELDGVVTGTVDTSSISGKPVVSLQIGDVPVAHAELRSTPAGLQVDATLDARPDLDARLAVILLPVVNVEDTPVTFTGIALVVTARTSIGGPNLVRGVVHSYEIHPLAGQASVVDF